MESDGNDSEEEYDSSENPSFSEYEDSMGRSEASDWNNQASKQAKLERTVSRRRRPLRKIFVSAEKEGTQVDSKKQ